MKEQSLHILYSRKIQKNIYRMTFSANTREITAPGQFINIRIPGFYLRRPISISDWSEIGFSIIYKVVGEGTRALASFQEGQTISALLPLGNGFDVQAAEKAGRDPVLIGGGIGVPPLLGLARTFVWAGVKPQVILGFNTKDDVILLNNFRMHGIDPVITTLDGSCGTRGMVTDVLGDTADQYLYTCGPEPMLRALYDRFDQGQFSFEARMACGFGACMGCSCKTKYGSKRICKDGPVLRREEIIW